MNDMADLQAPRKTSRALLASLALLLAGGCAGAGPARRGSVRIHRDGYVRVRFETTDPMEEAHAGSCRLLMESRVHPHEYRPHGGLVSVQGAGAPVLLEPDWHGEYRDAERRSEPLWSGAETVVIQSTGATAPAFRADVPGPAPIEPVELPREDANRRDPRISALRDLPVAWRGGDGSPVVVRIERPHYKWIQCEFDGAAGQGVVPHALLAEMPLGEVEVSIVPERRAELRAGRWTVRIYLFGAGMISPATLDSDYPGPPLRM